MPRYEFTEGTSNKFWEVELEGHDVVVTYGRIGTPGTTSRKSYPSEEAAAKKMQSQIGSKVRKGYGLVAAAELAAGVQATEARLVEADRLMGLGDPRGRLIQLQHAIEGASGAQRAQLRKEEKALLEANVEALLGPLADEATAATAKVEWRQGYWDRVTIAADYNHQDVKTAALTEAILTHPSAEHLGHLKLGIPDNVWSGMSNWQPAIDALAKVGSATLASLELADDDDNAEISWCEIGDFGAVWAACPALQKLRIRGVGITLGTVVAPHLRELTLQSGGLPAEPVRALGAASLPALETLEIWLGTEEYGATTTPKDCAGILAGTGLPALQNLGLMNGEIMDEIAEAVVGAAVVARLKTLNLSMGTMSDRGARALIAGKDALAHLDRLDVSENYLSARSVGVFGRSLPKAYAGAQKDPDEYDGETYTYVSVAE